MLEGRQLDHKPYEDQLWELVKLAWRGEGSGETLSLFTAPCDEVGIGLFSQVTVIGWEVMALSCTRAG